MKQSKIILFISIFVLIIQFENSNEAAIGPIIPIIARVLFKNAAKTGMKETAKTGIKETAKTGIKETAKSGVKQTANTGIKGAVKESPSRGTGQSIKQIVPKETAKVGMKDGAKSSIRNSGQQSIKPPVAVKETAKASMKSGTKESAKSSNRALNVQPVEGTKISSRGVGPSGKPMLHFPKFSSVKKAKEAAKHASHSKGQIFYFDIRFILSNQFE